MAQWAVNLFCVAIAGYVAAALFAVWTVSTGRKGGPDLAVRLAGPGFVFHSAALILWGAAHGRLPVYAPFEALVTILWCAMLGYLFLNASLRSAALSAFVLPTIALGAAAVAAFVRAQAEVATGARGLWLPIHAATALLGAADLLLAFIVAVMYLVLQRLLKSRTPGPLLSRMPSLDALDRLNYRAVALGMPVFTFALVSGVVLAVETGPGWWANWMVAASFLAWLVFVLLLHVRLGAGLRGPKVAYLTVLGFLLVAGITCGIAFVGDSLHTMRAPQRPPAGDKAK